ncbi:hypothetical protein [Paraburkholderia graminis]|uniref:hypothetical protein n=1 Tax=Paraburkholderia graminis TaxID=60548 RepID=UPI0013794CFA|nr:hypothetical protein [Paraburkholderia graminis]
MAISKSNTPKAPSQSPTSFYQGKQQGGAHGKPEKVGERLKGGPMREKMGKSGL